MKARFVTGKQPLYSLVELHIARTKPNESCNGFRITSKMWCGPIDEAPTEVDDHGNYYPLQGEQPENVLPAIVRSTQQYAERLIEQATAAKVGVFLEGVEGGEYYPKVFSFVFSGGLHVQAYGARIDQNGAAPSLVLVSDLISSADSVVAKLGTLTEVSLPFGQLSHVIEVDQDNPRLIPWFERADRSDQMAEMARFQECLQRIFGE